MKTFKAFKIKLYPTAKQRTMLDEHLNAYRYCYNLCLEYKSFMWKYHKINKSGYDMQNELFEIRKQADWLSKCKAECVREAALQVDASFKSFFNGKGYPKFKSKKGVQTFFANQNIKIKYDKIKFFGSLINFKTSKKYSEILQNCTIKRVAFNRDLIGDYWATCLIEANVDLLSVPTNNSIVGIDMGIKELVVTSENKRYTNNKYLDKTEFKLKKAQRKFSKTKKGGKNREKLRVKIAKIHKKVFNQKEHYYHQITNELIRDNQTIVMETLKINNMIQNKKLSRSISNAGWGLINTMLQYKSEWHERNLIKLNTFYPSTKTCSECGSIKDMPLKERTYSCENCGLSIDRDLNAAINIRNAGLKIPDVPVEGVGYEPNEAGSKQLIINN